MGLFYQKARGRRNAWAPTLPPASRAAFGWIAAHARDYGLDPQRVFLGGGSSGGHLSLATGILYPKEPVQPVRLVGVVDLYGGYFTEQIDAGVTPLLIIQGTADTSCLPEASQFMASLYRRAGAPYRLVLVEGMGHGWGGKYQSRVVDEIRSFVQSIDRFAGRVED